MAWSWFFYNLWFKKKGVVIITDYGFLLFILILATNLSTREREREGGFIFSDWPCNQKHKEGEEGGFLDPVFNLIFHSFSQQKKIDCKILYLTMNAENNYSKGKMALSIIIDTYYRCFNLQTPFCSLRIVLSLFKF